MRFVFVTDELPRAGAAGHLAMNHAIISWLLAGGHEVVVLLLSGRLRWPVERYGVAAVAGPSVFCWGGYLVASVPAAVGILARRVTERLPGPLVRILRPAAMRHRGGADAVLGTILSSERAAWCARRIGQMRPDAVLVDTMFRAGVLAAPEVAGMHSLIIAHDVFHLRHRALSSAGYVVRPAGLTREMEAAQLNLARAIAAIQPEEAAIIKTMCPAREVFVASMPALACPRPADVARVPNRLVFLGSASLPNLDGLRWFLDAVWPHLRRWRGDVTLDIAGDCGVRLARLPEGVSRRGRLKTLAPVLHRASLAIAPLRVGSGLKIKLLDYARHGLMTVGTPASLAGFAADPAAPFIAASGDLGFAAAIIRQLGAPAEDERALSYIGRHYGMAASFAALGAALGLPQPAMAG
jgi:succinoglycan biosynthesis protein ExoO